MISKTKIGARLTRKTDRDIVDTIIEAKKNKNWMKIAQAVSGSRRNYPSVNLKEIDKFSSDGDIIIVPGKVLGSGNINKKLRVCAISFSLSAVEKLKSSKGEAIKLIEEIRKNPKAQGVKIIG